MASTSRSASPAPTGPTMLMRGSDGCAAEIADIAAEPLVADEQHQLARRGRAHRAGGGRDLERLAARLRDRLRQTAEAAGVAVALEDEDAAAHWPRSFERRRRRWQGHANGGALPGFGDEDERAAVALHDGARHGQAEAGRFGLGREERLEDALLIGRVDAFAVVADDELHAARVLARAQDDPDLGARRFDGVEEQIEEALVELARVAVDARRAGVDARDVEPAVGAAAQEVERGVEALLHAHQAPLGVGAREAAQILDDGAGAARGVGERGDGVGQERARLLHRFDRRSSSTMAS